ncbi:cation efflux protein, partial [Basidiobolus meristosporus CBS 931.73]
AILGTRIAWWVDAAGALSIALLIMKSWTTTAYENIELLVGKSAEPNFLKKITYIALTHHPKVLQVDTCRAYYAGSNMFVEVDIVMAPDTLLIESHEIGESLQTKLESLPEVEHAFAHVNHESDHSPEHQKAL